MDLMDERFDFKIKIRRNYPFWTGFIIFTCIFLIFVVLFVYYLMMYELQRDFKLRYIVAMLIFTPILFSPLIILNSLLPYYVFVNRYHIIVFKTTVTDRDHFIPFVYSLNNIGYSYAFGKGIHLVYDSIYKYHLVEMGGTNLPMMREKEMICNALERYGIKKITPEIHTEWITDLRKRSKKDDAKVSNYWMMKGISPTYEMGNMVIMEKISKYLLMERFLSE